MGKLIDFDDHRQNVELKLLELRRDRGEHIDVSSPALRATVSHHVRRTRQRYEQVRQIGKLVPISRFEDKVGQGVEIPRLPPSMIDDTTTRRLAAWCELADLPKHILEIGNKRVHEIPLSVWEWNELRRFRNWYAAREQSYQVRERERDQQREKEVA